MVADDADEEDGGNWSCPRNRLPAPPMDDGGEWAGPGNAGDEAAVQDVAKERDEARLDAEGETGEDWWLSPSV